VAISGLILLGLASCATPSLQSANLGKTRPTKLGMVLVDSDGDTLYTYDSDSRGESKCTGTCAIVWPPVEAGSEARPTDGFSIITRPNGSRQWACKGKPLYGYIFDSGPGSVSGDGEDGVWHVARP
jgi:predicted lipoprotein with Yx(FWY)xxD motif